MKFIEYIDAVAFATLLASTLAMFVLCIMSTLLDITPVLYFNNYGEGIPEMMILSFTVAYSLVRYITSGGYK